MQYITLCYMLILYAEGVERFSKIKKGFVIEQIQKFVRKAET